MKIKNITSQNIPFVVRMVECGESYGLKECLTHQSDEPLVEFYDARYSHTPYGQFVSRYNKETLLKSTDGLNLDGGVPEWSIDKETMDSVRQWLTQSNRPKMK